METKLSRTGTTSGNHTISRESDVASTTRLLYLSGCDGTGKTTQAELLIRYLHDHGVATHHTWLRFPFLTSIPLLAYARWRGHSWYVETDGVTHGYWDFRKSRLLRRTLPWTMLLDAALAAVFNVYLPMRAGKIVVCERFVVDILVDLAVAFDDPGLHRRLPGRLYTRLLPQSSQVLVLDLDAETIRSRRHDLRSDMRLDAKLGIFRRIAADLKLPVVSSRLSIGEAHRRILDMAQLPYRN